MASPLFLNAQPASEESGKNLSTHHLITDTGLIIQQIKAIDRFAETNTDSAQTILLNCLESSRVLHFNRGLALGLSVQGTIYQIKNRLPQAAQSMQLALSYCDTSFKMRKLATIIYCNLGDVFWNKSQVDSATYFYYRALDEIEQSKIEDPVLLVETYYRMIVLWVNLNDRHNSRNEAMDKYIFNANLYLDKAAKLQRGNSGLLSRILISKGNIKRLLNDFDSSRYYYRSYLAIDPKDSFFRQESEVAAILLNISESFLIEKKADSAIWYAKLACASFKNQSSANAIYTTVACFYMGRGYILKKDYQAAISITEPALLLAQKQNLPYQYMAQEILAEAYAGNGNFEAAWLHGKEFSTISDSLKKAENMQAISQMEMKYQASENRKELAEKELSLVKKDHSIKEKNLFITAIATGLLLLVIAALFWYRQNLRKQQMLAYQATQKMKIANLQAAIDGEEKERRRLARELHDGIGGALGSIQMQLGLAMREKELYHDKSFKNIIVLLSEVYAELRKTAHNLMPEILQQQGFVQAASLFCEGISKGGNTIIIFETVGKIPYLPAGLELTLYRIIQEMLHNMVKHAQATEALVQLAFADRKLSLTIEDDGIGIDLEKVAQKDGMGINTIIQRVQAMGGKIDIMGSAGNGTSIYIELPVDENVNNKND